MYKLVLFLTLPVLSILGIGDNKMPQQSETAIEAPAYCFNKGGQEISDLVEPLGNTEDCSWEGFNLYGRVQFVTAFPDIKIQYVSAFPDIRVQWVDAFPDQCGKWQEVTSFPDFKVQVVTAFPDLKVQEVTSFPGMN
jgi:hypothetical protein